jgi:hypothetical protein
VSELGYEEQPDYDYLRRVVAGLGFGEQQLNGFEWQQESTADTVKESGDTMPNTLRAFDSNRMPFGRVLI